MTKEELEKEAEEYAGNTYEMCSYSSLPYASDRRARQQAFLAGAEPREKQIEIDAEQIRALQKQNGELTDNVKELEKENEIFKKANEIIAQQRDDRDADISKLENRIEDLEAQIEKMKCCENCKHHYIALDDTTSCKLLDRFASSKPCDKWEIKEK